MQDSLPKNEIGSNFGNISKMHGSKNIHSTSRTFIMPKRLKSKP
ncbi:hypothetical protein MXB_3565 [Myxobolus squamalis]|nr:hypothetical protein MXB_3565 [Myxobolus squamalis]